MLAEIKEKKASAIHQMRNLVEKAQTEKRSLNSTESAAFDELKSKVSGLEEDETRAAFLAESERRMKGTQVSDHQTRSFESGVSLLKILQAGMNNTPLTGIEAEYQKDAEMRTGRKAQGMFVPSSLFEKRANTTTSAPELVPTNQRGDLYIEPFRNALLARRLGVRVLSGLTGNLTIPRYVSGNTVSWVTEGGAVPEGNMDFDSITLTPKHVGGYTELSRQLLTQASPDVEQLVRDDLAAMIAKSIDTALIKGGTTAAEPKGVLATTGIQTANLATLTYANILAMQSKLELVNANAAAWLTSPGVATKLRGTLKSAGIAGYLAEGGRMADIPLYSTNQVPNFTGTPDKGIAILGDWSQVILGIFADMDILVNPYAEAPYKRGGVLVRAMSSVDIAVRHPEAFVVASDVTL